jgi:hypothetical protein
MIMRPNLECYNIMECRFCGQPAVWVGERNETKTHACDTHFQAYYISFWRWEKYDG